MAVSVYNNLTNMDPSKEPTKELMSLFYALEDVVNRINDSVFLTSNKIDLIKGVDPTSEVKKMDDLDVNSFIGSISNQINRLERTYLRITEINSRLDRLI